MSHHRNAQILTAILAIFMLAAGSAFGASVVVGADRVDFAADGPGTLTISGPDGFEYRAYLEAGSGSMSLFDEAGQPVADGAYNWQITLDGKAPEKRSAKPVLGQTFFGTFTLEGGAPVNPLALEVQKDQVFTDDLIVRSSACIGFDCADGESFGFDTIRMKENNTRIKFQDTSGGPFPTNDWELVANDTSSGGAERFSIEDDTNGTVPFTIGGDTPNHALYVESSTGDVGLGTSTPALELHIKDGDSPAVRLDQDSSAGWPQQTWDIAGNEAVFFVRDITGGNTLPFQIEAGAPNAAIYADSDGAIAFGNKNPESKLHVDAGSSAGNIQMSGNNVGLLLEDDTSVAQHFLNNDLYRVRGLDTNLSQTTAGISMSFTDGVIGLNCNDAVDGGSGGHVIIGDGDSCNGTWSAITAGSGITNSSSRTLKENLVKVEADGILEKISGINIYNYDFIEGPKDRLGLMAEDFHQVFGRGSDKLIHSQEVQMALWLAVKELTAQNRELSEKLSGLEAKLAR